VAAASGLALLALGLAELPVVVTAASVLLVLLAGGRAFGRASIRGAGRLRFLTGGSVLLDEANAAVLESSWRLGSHIVGLALRPAAGGRITVLLFRDRVPAADWRRLQVRLRLGG